ncbi:MAG: dethiobiotin synthase [Porphyromonas sp.]|nr:dethiobiotin synthase [Porphyromonas sp.]
MKDILPHSTYFVTGIDTDAGKSIATGWISSQLLKEGVDVVTQKLIQTGCDGISEDIIVHRQVENRPLLDVDKDGTTCPLVFSYPCSPHMATAIDNRPLELEKAKESTKKLLSKYDKVLIEGAGGLMVPLSEDYLTVDYIKSEELPVILVATAKLGSINHTLLTLEVLQKREIPVALLVYNEGIATDDKITAETRHYLETHVSAPLVVLPKLAI